MSVLPTVFIHAYNRLRLRTQTELEFEWLIVDGGFLNKIRNIVKQFSNEKIYIKQN